MQTVILAGGSGTRLREMTETLPKALIPIGGKPMIWHIMQIYARYGFQDFVLALGYKQEAFKQYFALYDVINNDITIDLGRYHGVNHHEYNDKGWRVTLVDTGVNTLKAGRLKRIEKYITGDTFLCSYGDGLANIDIYSLLEYHKSHGKMVTVTGINPKARFGEIIHKEGSVISFSEKPQNDGCLVNGGYMVMRRDIFDCLEDVVDLEENVFTTLAEMGELMVFHHQGWWGCMDTVKEMNELQEEWETGNPRWVIK